MIETQSHQINKIITNIYLFFRNMWRSYKTTNNMEDEDMDDEDMDENENIPLLDLECASK